MKKIEFIQELKKRYVDFNTIESFEARDGTFEEIWNTYPIPAYMMKAAYKIVGKTDRKLRMAMARCAQLVIDKTPHQEIKKAVEMAELYGKGECSEGDLDSAFHKAYAIFNKPERFKKGNHFATLSAIAASDFNSCDAAYYAIGAAEDGEKEGILMKCLDIIREHLPAQYLIDAIIHPLSI